MRKRKIFQNLKVWILQLLQSSENNEELRKEEKLLSLTEPCASKWVKVVHKQPQGDQSRKAKMHAKGSYGTML